MLWRYTTQTLNHLQVGMVLRNLRWKVSFGSGSHQSGSYQTVYQISLAIIGISALATTLLLGSFLWGFVSRKNKKNRATPTPFVDLYPRASHKPNTVVALREFAKPISSSSPKVADYNNTAFFDTLVFDAEQGYAQVLAEARSHAGTPQKRSSNTPSPVKVAPTFNDAKHAWVPRSSSSCRLNFLEDVESVGVGFERLNSSKSWKKLLFWKRSTTSNQFEFNIDGAVHSSCSTPLHYVFKSSNTRATLAPATPTKKPTPKRSTSGPLYTDGSPLTPIRTSRSFSGPLSASSTPNRDGLFESPYIPLRRPSSSPKLSSGPLYVT